MGERQTEEFPILCETCLGDNPYVRMLKAPGDKECKICQRPFMVFKWRPGHNARYKKTEICQTCAKLKNVCQTCLFDLEFGLPVQVRDSFLTGPEAMIVPDSEANREYVTAQAERRLAEGDTQEILPYQKLAQNASLLKMARTTPFYSRNRPHICSFFLKGTCNRGDECPYRHEMPDGDPELANQNIKDRYYGTNDPVALKIMRRSNAITSLTPPPDKSITTLYVGGINTDIISEEDIKDVFYGYGEIKNIRLVRKQSCAFITYTTRQAAEQAAEAQCNRLIIKGQKLKLLWGRPVQPKSQQGTSGSQGSSNQPLVNHMPAPLPPGMGPAPIYPSALPAMGSAKNPIKKV